MNRNTQIGILVAIIILAIGGWFVYDMYATKNTPAVTNPNGQTPVVTPTTTEPGDSSDFSKKISDISAQLTAKGVTNEYKDITEPFDTGKRFVFTFGDQAPDYQLFVMTPDFGLGSGEGGPTWFTPKDIDFATSWQGMIDQLQKPGHYREQNIQESKKSEINGVHFYWIFGDFGYVEPNLYVQALANDKNTIGYLLHVDIFDLDFAGKGMKAIEEVENNPFAQKIFSVIK